MRVAAIDQGTTSTRCIVFDANSSRLALSIKHQQFYPRPGWVEHDPLELLANVKACIDSAGPVDAIAIANQGESCLAWHAETGKPLSPVIVWQDSRTNDVIERLKGEGVEPEVLSRSGLGLDSYFSATKLAWILENSAPAQAALRAGSLRLGTTDSFFLERLAGTLATDPTTASRTSLMNIRSRQWDDELCRLFGVPRDCLAPIRPTISDFGLVGGIPIKASAVDQQAALYGHGCRMPGDAKVTFGTGAFALAVTGANPNFEHIGGLTSTVAWQSPTETTYALEGGVYDVGSVIEWAIRIGLLTSPSDFADFNGPSAMSRGIAFVPALSGLACPQWDRNAAGLFIGMTTATTRGDLQKALLEGIAMQTRAVLREMDKVVGLQARISVDGGLTGSAYFLQFLANVTDKTIVKRANSELTAYGCALLAGVEPTPETKISDVAYAPVGSCKVHDAVYEGALGRSLGWHRLHRH